MTGPAIVIEMTPTPTAALVAELHLEVARLRSSLGRVWEQRHDVTQAANGLLECHGSIELLDSLADELAIRAARGE